MQDKTFKFPFNERIFMESQKILWLFSFKKIAKTYYLYTLCGLVCLASAFIPHKDATFPTSIGLGISFYMLLKWISLFERRRNFFKITENFINRHKHQPPNCIVTFSDDSFTYQDTEKTLKLNWSLFSTFIVFKDHIFLVLKDTGQVQFNFSRQEAGDEVFDELQNLLKDRLASAKTITNN